MDFLQNVNILANTIVNTYFNYTYCIFIVTDINSELNVCQNIPVVFLNFANNTVPPSTLFNHYGCQDIVIQTTRPSETLAQFESEIKLTDERFNYRRYLILPTENSNNIMDIFEMDELYYIANILIVSNERSGISSKDVDFFNLMTNKYVGNRNNNEIVVVDKWFIKNQSYLYGNNLYPNKLLDQDGRELKIATFTYEPYSIAENTTELSDGTEMRLAFMFAQKHNMTPIMIITEKDDWGEIFDNWTGKGLLGYLAIDKADLGFAALYTWEHEYHFLDLSKPVSRTGITCLVPTPKLAAGWLTPLFPFSITLWIAVVVSFFASALSLTAISYAADTLFLKIFNQETHTNDNKINRLWKIIDQVFLRTVAIFLLQSISIKTHIVSDEVTKHLIGCILLVSLLIATTYSSGLASSMTIPRYEHPIRTTQDLADSDIPWGATSTAWTISMEDIKEEKYKKLVKNFIAESEDNLKIRATSGKFAFSMERLPHGHYAIGNYVQRGADLIPMTEDLYWENCVIMLRKHSVLLPALDELILRVAESGIQVYWESQVTYKYLDTELQRSIKYMSNHHDTGNGPVKLQWIHVEGAFSILAIGHFIALLCFLSEITIKRIFAPIPFTL